MSGVTLNIEGVKDVLKNFDKQSDAIKKDVFKAIIQTGEYGRDKAKQNLKSNDSVVTGVLRNSIKVNPLKRTMSVVVRADAEYAGFVEFGRKAGKMPPVDDITEWVVKKGILDTYSIKTGKRSRRGADFNYRAMSVAFLIAKKIQYRGTKAKPFFYQAFEGIERITLNAIRRNIKKHYK
jgi:hypothetical protein